MLTGDFHATREDLREVGEASAPPVEGAPARMFVATDGESRSARWKRIVPSTFLSVAFHVILAMAFVAVWRSMVQDLTAPAEPISVEVVHSIPGEDGKPASPAAQPETPKPEPPKPDPPPPAPPPPPPEPDPLPVPVPPAPPPPPTPETQTQQPEPPSPAETKGALAEPPPEPKAAATQDKANEKANAAEDPTKSPAPDETIEADTPSVLTVPNADVAVPEPTKEPDPQKPPKATDPDQQTSKEATAHLMAALPMSGLSMPSSFRAILSSAGTSESQQYKGAVYGVLNRAKKSLEEKSRSLHLAGLGVGLVITIGAAGEVGNIVVGQSSGRPDVDRLVVDLVRTAGPFPPPPPGAGRTFTPMILFPE